MSIKCAECVFVALGTRPAIRMRHIVIGALPGSTIIVFILSIKRHDLKKTITEHKMCILIFSKNFV